MEPQNKVNRALWLAIVMLSTMLVAVPMANGNGQAGTTLSAEKTAAGRWIRTYTWTISKGVSPTSLSLVVGEEADICYSILVTKYGSTDSHFVQGTITVTNGPDGDRPTEGLKIVDRVQYKMPGPGQFQDLPGASQTIIPSAQLAPGESKAYDYQISFTPVPGASYRNVVKVTITNHSGYLGEEFGPEPKADFSLPSSPTLLNNEVSVSEVETIPAGLTLVDSDEPSWPQIISETTTFSFCKTIKAQSVGEHYIPDTACVTGDTGELGCADAEVTVVVRPEEGYVTYTQGGWGSSPHGENPGSILATCWTSSVTVGSGNSMTFTSAAAIEAYLPAGGTPDVLTMSLINPISSSSGVFGGQVLALKLNLTFVGGDCAGGTSIGGLKLCSTGTSLDGKTVSQILAAAETALGGGALPSGYTLSSLNDLVSNLNNAFDGGTASTWAQEYLCN